MDRTFCNNQPSITRRVTHHYRIIISDRFDLKCHLFPEMLLLVDKTPKVTSIVMSGSWRPSKTRVIRIRWYIQINTKVVMTCGNANRLSETSGKNINTDTYRYRNTK